MNAALGTELAGIPRPTGASRIQMDVVEPKLGYPALFALGIVACDLISRLTGD